MATEYLNIPIILLDDFVNDNVFDAAFEIIDANAKSVNNRINHITENAVYKVAGMGLSQHSLTTPLLEKINNIENGAQVNPDMSLYLTKSATEVALNSKENKFTLGLRLNMSDTRELNVNTDSISYTTLIDVPTIPTDLNQLDNTDHFVKLSELNNVATTGDYRNLNHVPTDLNQFTNGPAFINANTEALVNYYKKSETYTKLQIDELMSESFEYEFVDVVPTVETALPFIIYFVPIADQENVYSQHILDIKSDPQVVVQIGDTNINLNQYFTKAEIETLLTLYAKITDLADVAFSGNYNDLINIPPIPDIISDAIVDNDLASKSFILENYEPKRTTFGNAYNVNFGNGENDVVRGNQVLTNVPIGAIFTDTLYDEQISNLSAALETLDNRSLNYLQVQIEQEDGTFYTVDFTVKLAEPTPETEV